MRHGWAAPTHAHAELSAVTGQLFPSWLRMLNAARDRVSAYHQAHLDPTAIWEWGVIERVASGLHCEQIDFQPLGRQTLAAADAVAGLDMP
jgi:hypothetical protein